MNKSIFILSLIYCSLLFSGCSKDFSSASLNPLLYEEIASEHSAALEFFFLTASEDEITHYSPSTKAVGLSRQDISDDYIIQTIQSYNFNKYPDIEFSVDATKSGSISDSELAKIISSSINAVVDDYSIYSSKERLTDAVVDYLSSIENSYSKGIVDAISISLYILIDSYDYWIEQDGFARWAQEFLEEEDIKALMEKYNLPDINLSTKASGAEMRAWSEMARADATAGGFLADCIDNDANGFIGGWILGRINVTAGLASAAWSSISSYFKNLL